MTSALTFILGTALGQSQASLVAPAHLRATRAMASTVPVAGSIACPEGGHVGTSGTFSIDTVGSTVFTLTDTLVDCGVRDNHSNLWAFTSKPTLAVTIDQPTNIQGDSIDISHSTLIQADAGSVGYTSGSLSGSCAIDVMMRMDVTRGMPTVDSATVSLSTAGTVCGQSVLRDTTTTTYSPPPP